MHTNDNPIADPTASAAKPKFIGKRAALAAALLSGLTLAGLGLASAAPAPANPCWQCDYVPNPGVINVNPDVINRMPQNPERFLPPPPDPMPPGGGWCGQGWSERHPGEPCQPT
jgi:hypothetical protein